MADSIQCLHCAAPNHGAARFCNNCGGLLVQPLAAALPAPASKKRPLVRWPFAVAGGLTLLFLVITLIAPTPSRDEALRKANKQVEDAQKRAVAEALEKARASMPVMAWASEHSESKALAPGEYVYGFQVQTESSPAKLRIDIQAVSPVTVAYYNSAYEDYVLENPATNLGTTDTECVSRGVLRNSIECELPASGSYKLLILDERTMQSSVIAGAAAALGIKGPAEQALKRNDVSLSLSSYRCVKNCRSY
jgi:hypothetical protein